MGWVEVEERNYFLASEWFQQRRRPIDSGTQRRKTERKEKDNGKDLRKVIGKKSEERCAFSEKGLQRIGENIQPVPPPFARQSALD